MKPATRIELRGQPIARGAHPVICTPLVGRSAGDVESELATVLPKHPDVIEWRVDYFAPIPDTRLVVDTARRMKDAAGGIPILFTRRSASEGGERVAIDEAKVVELYEAVCAARAVDLIDYELANPAPQVERLRAASKRAGIGLVLSYHNFQSTPERATLVAKFREAQRQGADVGKVAVMPNDRDDVLTLLGATWEASQSLDIALISMSMGAIGSISRIVGGVYGSALTFAVGKASSAPGQIPIDELRAALAIVNRAAAAN